MFPLVTPTQGWPLWSKDIAALYASELVLNGLVQHWEVSDRCVWVQRVEVPYLACVAWFYLSTGPGGIRSTPFASSLA